MFENYKNRLEELRNRMESIAEVAASVGENDIAERCRRQARRLQKRRFQVAVVGEFKAGKSTLINVLVAQDLLPIASKECTTVVTRVCPVSSGQKPGAAVSFTDGSTKELTIKELTIAEARALLDIGDREGQDVRPEEALLRIAGAVWLGDDVELVDTPGINAAGLARAKATLVYIPNADAIVFMTRADQLLPQSEMDFLKNRIAQQDWSRLFVIVNHWDRITSDRDRKDVMQRTETLLQPVFGAVRISFLSAGDAWEAVQEGDDEALARSGVPAFREQLEMFLTEDRAAAEIARHQRSVEALEGGLVQILSQRRIATTLTVEEAKRRQARINELIDLMNSDGADVKQGVQRAFEEIPTRWADPVIQRSAARLYRELEAATPGGREPDEARIRRVVDTIGGETCVEIQSVFRTQTARIQQHATERLNTLLAGINRELGGNEVAAMPELDLSDLALIETRTEEVPATENTSSSSGDYAAAGAAAGAVASTLVLGMVASFFLGPLGFLAAAALGGWGGSKIGKEIKVGEAKKSPMQTLRRMVTSRHINASVVANAVASRLQDACRQVAHQLGKKTCDDVKAIVRGKTEELEQRRSESGAGNEAQAIAEQEALEKAFRKLNLHLPDLKRNG